MNESQNSILIGVDGGGTGCRAAVADHSLRLLGEAKGARANVATDFAQAIQNIRKTIEDAGQSAGLPPEALAGAVVHLGLAGVLSDADANRVAVALPYSQITVTDDRPTAVEGALGGQDGFLISVGTGTIIAARKAGRNSYVGGWGFYLADQASGAWLGRRLLQETLLAYDQIKPGSDITSKTLAGFDNDPNQIAAFSLTAKPGEYGRFAPGIVAAAQTGDPVAGEIIAQGVDYLVKGLRRLGFRDGDRLCITGGVGQTYLPVLPAQMTANTVSPLGSPAQGALRLAARNRSATR